MEKRIKKGIILFAISIALVLITVFVTLLILYPNKEVQEEVLWWKDEDNLQYVVEDERSDEKVVMYSGRDSGIVEFHYTYNEFDTKEYIPKIRVLHKGVEQKTVSYIYKREHIHQLFGEERRDLVGYVASGYYEVSVWQFLNQTDREEHENDISRTLIKITVERRN